MLGFTVQYVTISINNVYTSVYHYLWFWHYELTMLWHFQPIPFTIYTWSSSLPYWWWRSPFSMHQRLVLFASKSSFLGSLIIYCCLPYFTFAKQCTYLLSICAGVLRESLPGPSNQGIVCYIWWLDKRMAFSLAARSLCEYIYCKLTDPWFYMFYSVTE